MEIETEGDNTTSSSSSSNSFYNRKNPTRYQFSENSQYQQTYLLSQQYISPSETNGHDKDDEFVYRENEFLDNDSESDSTSLIHVENGVISFLNQGCDWIVKKYKYWISGSKMDYREAKLKVETKKRWNSEKEPLFIFIATIVVFVYAFKYFEIGKQFAVVHMFVDSRNRVITNPVLNPDCETIIFFDVNDIMEMDEWAEKSKNIPKLERENLEMGFIEMDVYDHETKRNVSIELMLMAMESFADEHSCISALNFGIIQNVILIKKKDGEQSLTVTMYDPVLDTISYDKVTASIMKKVERNDGTFEEVVVKKIQVPKKIVVEFYDQNYKKLRLTLTGEESACVYQFIDLYKTLSHIINDKSEM